MWVPSSIDGNVSSNGSFSLPKDQLLKLDNVSTVHFPMKVRWSADNVRERIEYKTDEDN